jgi:ribosomal protein L29
MSLEGIEARLLEVNSELTRLRSHEAELNTRLKELRGSKIK